MNSTPVSRRICACGRYFYIQKKKAEELFIKKQIHIRLCKRYHWSSIQPLSHRWFLIKGIKAFVCPFAVLRSCFGLRYSRVRGRRQSKFLASSSTGGARNFYPCTGEPRTACIVLFQKFTQKTAAGIVRRHSLSKNEAFRQTDPLHADRVQGSVIFCLSGGLCFAAISGKV